MKTFEGKLVSQNVKVGIVAARFNEFITSKLLSGAMDGLCLLYTSRIENLWPGDGSCPLMLRSKRFINKCFRIVKTQKISSGALLIWWGHRSHRTQFLPLFCSGVDEKSVSRPVGSWNFQGAIFPEKEKYRPRSAAMILSGESAAKWIGCVAGR